MNLINPVEFYDNSGHQIQNNSNTPSVKKEVEVINSSAKPIMDFSFFTSGKAKINALNDTSSTITEHQPSAPKRGRPRKQTKTSPDGTEYVPADENDIPEYQSNQPYIDSYKETNNLLKTSIVQIDVMNNDLKGELDSVRASKTLKNKYTYISDMSGTMSTLIGTKISAIREINKSITDAHNLEIRRAKDLKLAENEVDDDRKIMDLYNSFISTPVGNYQLGPNSQDMAMMNTTSGIIRADIQSTGDMGYDNYMNNLTPAQNMMRYETNPNIKTVVIYDAQTGARRFEVMDMQTQQVVDNVSRPDPFLLEDCTIDVNRGVARNTNLDMTYPLITVNNSASITQY